MAYQSVYYRSLKNRHIVITGGACGIGAEMVKAFCQQQAAVSFIDIDYQNGQRIAEQTGGQFYPCDLTRIDDLRETMRAIEKESGAASALVNNAGKDDRHSMDSVDTKYWRHALALNLDHQFFATQALASGMARIGGGSIIMLGSISWMRGRPGMIGYTTAKAAINGMTKTLARELGTDNIRVNCIVPGAVLTARQQALWLTPEHNQAFIEQQALKFRLNASHIARMALFLASDESSGCTGANFIVDAGLTQN